MVISGKILFYGFWLLFLSLIGVGFFISQSSKGREYNRNLQLAEQSKKECLLKMSDVLKLYKESHTTFKIEDFETFADEFEFIYFPDNYFDMQQYVVIAKEESVLHFKNWDGTLRESPSSLGFYVIIGGNFQVKQLSVDKVKVFVDLIESKKGLEVDPKYYSSENPKAFLIKKQVVTGKK